MLFLYFLIAAKILIIILTKYNKLWNCFFIDNKFVLGEDVEVYEVIGPTSVKLSAAGPFLQRTSFACYR